METRKITVTDTSTQSRIIVETNAETLGELKKALAKKGFNYSDKVFYEGLSKSTLEHDNAILPKDVPFKGTITNNLAFRLTIKNKKIQSGSLSERQSLFAEIKKLNLVDDIKEKYGKNYTILKSDILKQEIQKAENSKTETIKNTTKSEKNLKAVEAPKVATTENVEIVDVKAREAIKELIHTLNVNDLNNDFYEGVNLLHDYERDYILNILEPESPSKIQKEETCVSPYSESELDEIFGDF